MAINWERIERRISSRIKLLGLTCYQIKGTPEYNNVVSNDIGLGGISFIVNNFIPPQTPVKLEINLLSRILSPAGRVAWALPLPHSYRYRVGIEFMQINPMEKEFLADYLKTQSNELKQSVVYDGSRRD